MSKLIIGGREFNSRLFVGTGKFSSNDLMQQAILASESEMVTVAMKRVDMDAPQQDDILAHIRKESIQLLPNTSGVRNAEEAVLAAQLAREAFGTNFIKLEIHPDPKYLLPRPGRDPESYRRAGKNGLCRVALHTGRPRIVQATRRGRCGHGYAAGSPHRYQ